MKEVDYFAIYNGAPVLSFHRLIYALRRPRAPRLSVFVVAGDTSSPCGADVGGGTSAARCAGFGFDGAARAVCGSGVAIGAGNDEEASPVRVHSLMTPAGSHDAFGEACVFRGIHVINRRQHGDCGTHPKSILAAIEPIVPQHGATTEGIHCIPEESDAA